MIHLRKLENISDAEKAKFFDLLVTTTDWKMLKRQKLKLVTVTSNQSLTKKESEALDGITNFLDFIQDSVIDLGAKSPKEVLGTRMEQEEVWN